MTRRVPIDWGTVRWIALLFVTDVATWVLGLLYVPLFWPIAVLAFWSALSLGAVIVLYAAVAFGHNPGAVLKGAKHWWLQPVFFPFRVVSWLVFAATRKTRREEVLCEVIPGVFLGPRLFPGERALLDAKGIRYIVDVTSEMPTAKVFSEAPFERYAAPLLDRVVVPDDELDRAVAWVLDKRARGERVFIHCAFGRGRSAQVACAAVIATGEAKTAEESLAIVLRARPSVRLRPEAMDGLRRFAERHARTRL